jgi:peptidoglycan/xylan/chitin deacetylase (PgdA/CDA1 family)
METFSTAIRGRNGVAFRAIKLCISMVFLGCVSFWRGLVRLFGRPAPGTCSVLYYHSVPAQHRHAFAKQVEMIVRLTKPVSADDVLTLVPGMRHTAVTFDDAFGDVIENAVPELVKRRVPAVIFVTTGVLGQVASWWPESAPERNRPIATAKQLQQLPAEWITLGAHTKTHPRLSKLNEVEAKSEILGPRGTLADLFGCAAETFSFPYGDFNEKLICWCKEAGYKRVFTTLPKQVSQGSEQFVVGRVSVEPTDWKLEFQLKLLGGYSWMPWAFVIKRKILAFPLVKRSIIARMCANRSAAIN